MKIIDWLLQTNSQGVRRLTLTRLLGEPTEEIKPAPPEVFNTRPVSDVLKDQKPEGYWGKPDSTLYARPHGTYYKVHLLSEFGAHGKNDNTRRAAEFLIVNGQTASGGFSISGREEGVSARLTANTLRALILFGLSGGRVRKAATYLVEKYREHGDFYEPSLATSLERTNYPAFPAVMKALSHVPNWREDPSLLDTVRSIVEEIKRRAVFHARPAREEQWAETARKLGSVEALDDARREFLDKHPDALEDLETDESWLKMSFPCFGETDALDALYGLAEAGIPDAPEYAEALEYVIRRRNKDGTWSMDETDVPENLGAGKPGEPSKWITLKCLITLKHFGRWNPPTMV